MRILLSEIERRKMTRINFHNTLISIINEDFNHEMYIKDGDNNYHKISDITIYGYRKVKCEDGYDTYVK